MNTKYLSCVLLVMCLGVAQADGDVIEVTLIHGQSNAVGGGHVDFWQSGPTINEAVLYAHNSGTGVNDVESWGPLQLRRTGHTSSVVRRWYGQEMTYGHAVADRGNQAIIKYARSGTSLHTEWAEDGAQRLAAFEFVDSQIAELENLGHTVKVTSMIWNQGEADSGSLINAEVYAENLQNLYDDFRARYNAPNLKIIIPQLHVNLNRGAVQLAREQQQQFVSANRNAWLVDLDDLALGRDRVHYTSLTHQTVGFRMAAIPEPTSMAWAPLVLMVCWRRSRD